MKDFFEITFQSLQLKKSRSVPLLSRVKLKQKARSHYSKAPSLKFGQLSTQNTSF